MIKITRRNAIAALVSITNYTIKTLRSLPFHLKCDNNNKIGITGIKVYIYPKFLSTFDRQFRAAIVRDYFLSLIASLFIQICPFVCNGRVYNYKGRWNQKKQYLRLNFCRVPKRNEFQTKCRIFKNRRAINDKNNLWWGLREPVGNPPHLPEPSSLQWTCCIFKFS